MAGRACAAETRPAAGIPGTVSAAPATLSATAPVATVAPSMAPVADSVAVYAAAVADSPTEPRSAGSPGISIPMASFTPMMAFLIVGDGRSLTTEEPWRNRVTMALAGPDA